MNLIKNASFLDGPAQGFTGSAGGVLTVDESVFGAPGRSVLVLTQTPGNGNTMTLSSNYLDGPAVTSGDLLEVFLGAKSTINNLQVKLQIQAGGEVVIPLKEAHPGPASRGIPATFGLYRGRVTSPSTGQARLQLSATATNGAEHIFALFHPYIEKVAPEARLRSWTPGHHFGADLDLPVWPSNFPQFRPETVSATPTSVRKGFVGDAQIPVTSRTAIYPAYNFQGDLELSAAEYDQLERLCYEESEPFWFVRPDTAQLCHAYWKEDGQPNAQGSHNVIRRVSVGLLLQVT